MDGAMRSEDANGEGIVRNNQKNGNDEHPDPDISYDNNNGKNENCSNLSESMLSYLLKELQLEKYYPQKMTLMDVIRIQDTSNEHHNGLIGIPWVFLSHLMMNNYKARDVFIEQHLEKDFEISKSDDWNFDDISEDLEDDPLKINPLDLLLVIFECCSYELRQVLAKKLFLCRQAIPFVQPLNHSNVPVIGFWSILPIIIDHGSKQTAALQCPCHVVSFIRIGDFGALISKSKILNQLLSDQYHDTFFNRDCPLGTNKRLISGGMVEVAWQLPYKDSDDVMLFLNLRGDGLRREQQLRFLSQISSVIVVMLDLKHLENEVSRGVLRSLHECNPGIVLCIDANNYNSEQKVKNMCQRYLKNIGIYKTKTKICKLALNGRQGSFSDIKKDLVRRISELTCGNRVISLKDRLQNRQTNLFTTDEEITKLLSANKKVFDLLGTIPSNCDDVKARVVPLQGKFWQNFSEQLKASKKSSRAQTISTIKKSKADMKRYRQNQVKAIRVQGHTMKLFTENSLDRGQILFITYLKLYLDERSRTTLPKFLNLYKQAWQEWKAAKDKGETGIPTLQIKLQTAERNLADASFGFEHLLRECGQMYEAVMECKDVTSDSEQEMVTSLSKVCAKLLLLGQPFEVMDGAASNVPIRWIKAVLGEIKQLIGDKKLLSLSVLGIQSSGKSTLLNTMFGLQFAVSAVRCTRGVLIQLIPVDQKGSKFDYLLVIDTEGVRASELAHEKHDHDNKLATFVIGLGDITLINIKEANTAEMKDILQIAVHAFLRLKLANATLNLKPSCVFVHQNVSAVDAKERMVHERQKLVEKLDEMTKKAAQQELITNVQSFNQVIEFNSDKDIWYFSDLWIGNPPMAPTNPGYCKNVFEVKNAVLSKLATSRDTFLTITDTITRIEDLWNGILTDDFVFAFRNSLEVKAYSNMEKEFQDARFEVSTFFAEFILNTAKVQIENCCNETDLQARVDQITLTLQKQASTKVLMLQTQMEKFVKVNELKDVMIQWIDIKKMRLETLKESLIASTEKDISRIKEEKRVQLLQATAKVRHETQINERARDLAKSLKGKKANERQKKEMFENMWVDLLKEFSSTIENTDDGISIQARIEAHVWDQFQEISSYLNMQQNNKQYHPLSTLGGTLSIDDFEEDVHFEIQKNVLTKFVQKPMFKQKIDNTIDKQKVREIADIIFRRIDTKLVEITSLDIQFNINFVNDILKIIVITVDDHNSQYASSKKLSLLPPYKALLVLHVLPSMTTVFIRHNEEYNRRHSSKSQLEKYKATTWELFQNLVSHATEEIIAAGFLKMLLKKKL